MLLNILNENKLIQAMIINPQHNAGKKKWDL